MGSVPIVLSSPMDRLFDDLPVIIVHTWNELKDATNLERWLERVKPHRENVIARLLRKISPALDDVPETQDESQP